jgi:hypothetical protein
MGARADFRVFTFNEHLGDNQSDINTDFTFMGQFSSTKVFEINQEPFNSAGFVQYQVSRVDSLSHEILINGQPLPGVDVHHTGHDTDNLVQTHTDVIPASFFKKGQNTIRFQRKGGDNFLIHHVIVHWRELDPS